MGHNGGNGTAHERHMDARALRFAVIFAVLLSAALLLGGFLIRDQLPSGVVPPAGAAAPSPFPCSWGSAWG